MDFNPLDPLGIFEPIRRDLDKMIQDLPRLPGPPSLARRTEEERAIRHGSPPPERGTGFQKLLDPLGIFNRGKGVIGNPIPIEMNGDIVSRKGAAREQLIGEGFPASLVDRSLTWWDEWVMGMARRVAPGQTNMQRQIIHNLYPQAASMARQWMTGIRQALGV